MTLTSLKRHCDIKLRATGTFLVSMERGDPYLYIFQYQNYKNLNFESRDNHPPSTLVDVLQKMAQVEEG